MLVRTEKVVALERDPGAHLGLGRVGMSVCVCVLVGGGVRGWVWVR